MMSATMRGIFRSGASCPGEGVGVPVRGAAMFAQRCQRTKQALHHLIENVVFQSGVHMIRTRGSASHSPSSKICFASTSRYPRMVNIGSLCATHSSSRVIGGRA